MAKRDNRKGQAAREQDDPIGPSTALASESMMPLDFMLWIMRNPDAELADRKWAASQAAPYCHARLSTERGHDASLSHEDFLDLL